LAAELKNAFGIEADLIPSSNGAFDVSVDGKIIFSRYEVFRFPDPGEIAALIKSQKQ
jgi:selT/selW/selH-like putative selenoprotein